MHIQTKLPLIALDTSQINQLKETYHLTEIEIRTYVRLNYKYRKNAGTLLGKLLKD